MRLSTGSGPPAAPEADPEPEAAEILAEGLSEDGFWAARPLLGHVQRFARARMVAPWAALGAVLVSAVAAVDPHVVLPPTVGSFGSLNLFIVLVGPPGAGKDAAISLAEDILRIEVDEGFVRANLGTGQGIAKTYGVMDTKTRETVWMTRKAVFTSSEIDQITAHSNQSASTLLATLRDAWMGAPLGHAYADVTKRVDIPKHSYRMCMLVGAQPTRAEMLLGDKDGGTPQRMVWLPAIDPLMPEELPEEPESPWVWTPPVSSLSSDDPFDPVSQRVVLGVCDIAREKIVAERRKTVMGNEDGGYNGHLLFARLKVAAALALLDKRTDVNEEDWQLAGFIMYRSSTQLDRIEKEIDKSKKAKAIREAEIAVSKDSAINKNRENERLSLVVEKIKRRMPDDWCNHAAIRKFLTVPQREMLEDALEYMEDNGMIEVQSGYEESRGQHWRKYKINKG